MRYELGGDHTFTFVEGVVAHNKAPGNLWGKNADPDTLGFVIEAESELTADTGIENVVTSDEMCFAYYKPYCAESFDEAVAALERYIATDGPFDGVVAFSQGASLAMALLVDESQRQRSGLRCGIFLCGRLPFVDAGRPRSASPSGYSHPPTTCTPAGSTETTPSIDMPTAHIWGAKDEVEPGQGLALYELCRSGPGRHGYMHGGGHEVPSARNKEDLVESANTIRRMLAQL